MEELHELLGGSGDWLQVVPSSSDPCVAVAVAASAAHFENIAGDESPELRSSSSGCGEPLEPAGQLLQRLRGVPEVGARVLAVAAAGATPAQIAAGVVAAADPVASGGLRLLRVETGALHVICRPPAVAAELLGIAR